MHDHIEVTKPKTVTPIHRQILLELPKVMRKMFPTITVVKHSQVLSSFIHVLNV